MFPPLILFSSLLFLLFPSTSCQTASAGDEQATAAVTKLDGGTFAKTNDLLDIASEFCQKLGITDEQSVTYGQIVADGQIVNDGQSVNDGQIVTVGQTGTVRPTVTDEIVATSIERMKPFFVEFLCHETIGFDKNNADKFGECRKLHKAFCVQLKEDGKSIGEAAKAMEKAVLPATNFIVQIEPFEQFAQNIQNWHFLIPLNKALSGAILRVAIDKFLPPTIYAITASITTINNNNNNNGMHRRVRRAIVPNCTSREWCGLIFVIIILVVAFFLMAFGVAKSSIVLLISGIASVVIAGILGVIVGCKIGYFNQQTYDGSGQPEQELPRWLERSGP